MRKHILFLLALALTVSFRASAQSFIENSQVSGSFQTDAQYYMLDKGIGITDLNGKIVYQHTGYFEGAEDELYEEILKVAKKKK